jgi:hypothetical protein
VNNVTKYLLLNFTALLALLAYAVRHHTGTANILSLKATDEKHFKLQKESWILRRTASYNRNKMSDRTLKELPCKLKKYNSFTILSKNLRANSKY